MRGSVRSTERNPLDGVRPQMAKAVLSGQGAIGTSPDRSPSVQSSPFALTAIVRDALLRSYGSLKAAAITMGEMDQAQLTRELDSGKLNLARLELLDDAGKAELSRQLIQVFGAQLEDPKARARRLCDEMTMLVNELRQFIEAA